MRKLYFLSVFILSLVSSACAQSSQRLHEKSVLIDTHNDVLSSAVLDGVDISHRIKEGHSDLERWKEGGVDVQFFSVWTGEKARTKEGFYNDAQQEIDSLNKLVAKNPQRMLLARTYREVKKGIRQKKLVALIGVEGGHMIESDLGKLQHLFDRGMRYLTLTWNNSTEWASSAKDETAALPDGRTPANTVRKGLSDFGKEVVRKMNELGIIVDLSHVGEQTFYDALAVTTKPVMLSHSSVWSICPVFRNVKDEQIRAVAANGGVICINFYSGFINKEYEQRLEYFNSGPGRKALEDSIASAQGSASLDSTAARSLRRNYFRAEMKKYQPTIAQLVDHIDYIIRLVGDDYVGIGSDFDGVSALPQGLDDVTTYPKITEELVRRGYSKKTIRKILGGNVMRVMKANFR